MSGTPQRNELNELREQALRLQSEASELLQRIRRLEQETYPETQPAPEPIPPPLNIQMAAPAPGPAAVSVRQTPGKPESTGAIEMAIGGTWLNRIGGLILLLAVGFFVKYSFDQGWISPPVRVIAGGCLGLLLIGAGELSLARGLRMFAGGLLGAGTAVLYLAAFGAHSLYHLVSTETAFVLYCGITLISTAVAVHGRIQAVAILALIGGFWTPLALSTGQNQQVTLMTYLLVLDAGFLFCGSVRRWDALRTLCWLGTAGMFFGWYWKFYSPEALVVTVAFLAAFYAMFHGEALFSAAVRAIRSCRLTSGLVHVNNAVFFATFYFLAGDEWPRWMGLLCLCFGLAQLFLARLLRDRADEQVCTGLVVDGAVVLTLAVPIQFDLYLVPIAWCVQGVVTTWIGRRVRRPILTVSALGMMIAAFVHAVACEAHETSMKVAVFQIGPAEFTRYVLLVVGIGLSLYLATARIRPKQLLSNADQAIAATMLTAGTCFILFIFSDQFDRYVATDCWIVLLGCWLAVALRNSSASVVGMGLCLAVGAKFVFWDMANAAGTGEWEWLQGVVLNRAVMTGLLAALVLLAAPALARQVIRRLALQNDGALTGLSSLLAPAMLFSAATFEIARVFQFEPVRHDFQNPARAMQVWLSVFWSVFAVALLSVGFARRVAAQRYAAIGVFFLTIVKVMVFDVSHLKMIYRIVSFFAVGVLLLVASLLYQRLSARVCPPPQASE